MKRYAILADLMLKMLKYKKGMFIFVCIIHNNEQFLLKLPKCFQLYSIIIYLLGKFFQYIYDALKVVSCSFVICGKEV